MAHRLLSQPIRFLWAAVRQPLRVRPFLKVAPHIGEVRIVDGLGAVVPIHLGRAEDIQPWPAQPVEGDLGVWVAARSRQLTRGLNGPPAFPRRWVAQCVPLSALRTPSTHEDRIAVYEFTDWAAANDGPGRSPLYMAFEIHPHAIAYVREALGLLGDEA